MSTLTTASGSMFVGMAGVWTDGPDNMSRSVWFAARASGEIFCEIDDAGTDSSVTSGVTATTAQWKRLKIDATAIADIKFYIDDVRVASGTTFGFAGTGDDALMQPYVGCYKVSGVGVGVLKVDYARVWCQR